MAARASSRREACSSVEQAHAQSHAGHRVRHDGQARPAEVRADGVAGGDARMGHPQVGSAPPCSAGRGCLT